MLLAGAALSLLLGGCASPNTAEQQAGTVRMQMVASGNCEPCQDNKDHFLPFITCQPVDRTNALGTTAIFFVRAEGALKYQWFFFGPGKKDFEALPDERNARLIKHQITAGDYGSYYCVISSEYEDGWETITQTRIAELGGRPSLAPGGAIVPLQYSVASGTTTSVCGQTVSGKWVRFADTRTADPGTTKFQGALKNVTTGDPVPKGDYLLQIWRTVASCPCATPLADPSNEVSGPSTAGYVYRFIAHFKVGKAPPVGSVIELNGQWL